MPQSLQKQTTIKTIVNDTTSIMNATSGNGLPMSQSVTNQNSMMRGPDIKSKYMNGVRSLPQIGLKDTNLYLKLSNIVKDLIEIKGDKVPLAVTP